jgi:hypothetical protein
MTVDPEDDHLLALARAIDDEAPIDWHAVEDSVPGEGSKAVLSELRVLHGLARVARDPDGVMTTPAPVNELARGEPPEPTGSWGALTVFEEIGRGAFSRVYRARDSLGRDVALKVFRDPTDSARLLDEGRRLTRVRHDNVVVVHGAAQVNGQVGLWMELIRGRTLEDELKTRGAFSAQEARLIGLDLCRALAAVHQAGLVHRDVKAQNVMREQGGRIVLMDFGAGTEAEAADQRDVAGTPMYLAPEVFDGQPASRLSDIYSLGVLLYHLVTGSYPLSGSSRFEIQRAHAERRIKRLRDARPDLPEAFVQLVETALADSERRYQTAGELEHALSSGGPVRVPPPRPPIPWRRAAVVAASVLAVALIAVGARNFFFPDPTVTTNKPEPIVPSPVPVQPTYTVGVTFYKYAKARSVPLGPGDRVKPGDEIGARVESSIAAYVYVVNEDDQGECYLLYPLPGQESSRPLAAGTAHQLPGAHEGEDVHWQVTSAGGREHFVVFVSPDRMPDFDQVLKALPRPSSGRPVSYPQLTESTLGHLRGLRGVGGIVSRKPAAGSSPAHYLFEGANPLGTTTETTHGLWMRQLTLANPGA